MFRRRVNQLKKSLHGRMDHEERLLPTVELYEYPLDGITNAAYNAPKPNTFALQRESKMYPHENLSFNQLRRILTSLNFEKIGSYVDTLTRRPPQRLRSQWVLLQDNEELACCDPVKTSSETLFGEFQVKEHLAKAKRRSGSDTGLRSTVDWYFWSPEAAKNCPSLEFLRIHLAPTNVWL